MLPYARVLALAAAATVLAAPAQASNTAARGFGHGQGASKEPPGQARKALRAELGRFGLVTTDPRTGTPRAVGRLDGFLTGANGGDAADVALGYLRAHGNALGLPDGVPPGLTLVARSSTGGIQRLEWRQSYRGIPSSDTGLRATVTASGRLLSLGGAPAPDPSVATIDPKLPPQKAYAAVAGHAPRITSRETGAEQATTFAGGGRASLVLYQGADGTRLGWRVLAPVSEDEFADANVDAADGTVVRRANRIKHATAKVYPGTPDDSAQITFPWPTAWLPATATTLNGPFVHAIADETNAVKFGALTVPAGAEIGDWDDAAGTRNQATTQLFYLANLFQEHLAAAPISFTTQNFHGADAVIAQARDGGETGNASFTTLPDGQPGLLAVGKFGSRDGTNDPTIVFHEYTHGMTGRLVTDAQGFSATDTAQASAIDEGTSDFYALDELDQTVMGPYVAPASPTGIRNQAITGNFTYADFGQVDSGPEPHADGEIWAQTLWGIRAAVGSETARRIFTEALRIVPPQPSYLDMRNAILQANTSSDASLWAVFADRGMGYFASTDGSDDVDPVADDTDPAGLSGTGVLQGTVRDEDGNPLPGAHVGIAGQDTGGLGPVLAADTDANGFYAISGFTGTHPLAYVSKPAYGELPLTNVTFPSTRNVTLARDFASAAGGAAVASFSGPDHTAEGCGPGGLIDDSGDTVWGSESGGVQTIVVDLGAQVDVQSVAIDPSAGCGDDQTAALGGYQVLTAASPGAFTSFAGGAFTAGDLGGLNPVAAASRQGVRYVQLRALSPQDPTGDSGQDFLDVAELRVERVPGSPVGPAVDSGPAANVTAKGATLTGTVRPNGAPPAVTFEYGTSASYGKTAAASGTSGAVSAALTGLTPLTEYHYRLVATRDGRRSEGADQTFVTPREDVITPPPTGGVQKLVFLKSARKLTATRAGVFRVKIAFSVNAPAGSATVKVARKGKTIARQGRIMVVPGATRTVKLKLNARGRRSIKPGKTQKVRVTVTLPGSSKAARTLKLKRRR